MKHLLTDELLEAMYAQPALRCAIKKGVLYNLMPDKNTISTLPSLDDMLQSLLLIEEGEHEFLGRKMTLRDAAAFFPITRNCVYLNHAANRVCQPSRAFHIYLYRGHKPLRQCSFRTLD